MRFRRKVHHDVRLFFLKESVNALPVTNIHFYKAEIGPVHYRGKRGKITGVCQFINTHDPVFRMPVQFIENKIAPDKTSSAGHDNSHSFLHFCFKSISVSKHIKQMLFTGASVPGRKTTRPIFC